MSIGNALWLCAVSPAGACVRGFVQGLVQARRRHRAGNVTADDVLGFADDLAERGKLPPLTDWQREIIRRIDWTKSSEPPARQAERAGSHQRRRDREP